MREPEFEICFSEKTFPKNLNKIINITGKKLSNE